MLQRYLPAFFPVELVQVLHYVLQLQETGSKWLYLYHEEKLFHTPSAWEDPLYLRSTWTGGIFSLEVAKVQQTEKFGFRRSISPMATWEDHEEDPVVGILTLWERGCYLGDQYSLLSDLKPEARPRSPSRQSEAVGHWCAVLFIKDLTPSGQTPSATSNEARLLLSWSSALLGLSQEEHPHWQGRQTSCVNKLLFLDNIRFVLMHCRNLRSQGTAWMDGWHTDTLNHVRKAKPWHHLHPFPKPRQLLSWVGEVEPATLL